MIQNHTRRLAFLIVAAYAWFVVVGKVIWWIDFPFLRVEPASGVLRVVAMLAFLGLMVVGMLPAATIGFSRAHVCDLHGPPWRRIRAVSLFAAQLTVSGVILSLFVFVLALPISMVSEDAAEMFIRLTTIMRQ